MPRINFQILFAAVLDELKQPAEFIWGDYGKKLTVDRVERVLASWTPKLHPMGAGQHS